jgi:hypothetical protein
LRDEPDRQRVACSWLRLGSTHNCVTDLEIQGRYDVATLTISVEQERDARRAVRVIFDGLDLSRYTDLVPLKVNDPIATFVPAASTANRDLAPKVAPRTFAQRLQQWSVRLRTRDLGKV